MRRIAQSLIPMLLVFLWQAIAGAQVDETRLRAHGLQVTKSTHLTMITDVRQRADVAEFHEVFAQAVGQWCEYFDVPSAQTDGWHLTCSVILDKEKFIQAGLLTDDLPPFPAGYQLGSSLWVYLQDGDYYTRHLLLHEGTHAFMEKFLGGYGAPWYGEGMAELLAVHQWKNGKLTINHQLASRDEVPYWGRVKLIRKDCVADHRLTLDDVLSIEGESFQQVRFYGWAWAACEFFDSHPEFQAAFRQLSGDVQLRTDSFNQQLKRRLADRWLDVQQQWNLMIDEIEYGYDVARATPVLAANLSARNNGVELNLAVDRGWQSTGLEIAAGTVVKVAATGQFQVKHDGQPWPCTSEGVTIEYYNGRPLGRLIAGIQTPDASPLQVFDVGAQGEFPCPVAGTLWLRINDSPAYWNDNQGELQVTVETVSD